MASKSGAVLPAPPPGVDLDAEFVNVTPERYTSVPKSSHRDGSHRLDSLLALGVLTLYLSNKTGWKIPNAETLATKWKEGADRIRAAVADLERAGFLVRFRIQGERGRWVTRTFVSADPASLEQIRQYAAALEAAYAAVKASKTATSTDGTFSQVGPDGGFRDSVDRDSVDRHSVTGHLKNQETDLGEHQEDPPLPQATSTAAPAADQAATGGSDSLDEETRGMLNEAAEAAAAVRAGADGWKPAQVRAAVRAALTAGHPPALIAQRLAEIAADVEGTAFPTRLRKMLDAQAAEAIAAARKADAPAAGSTPPWAEGPVRYLDNDRARCGKHPGHPGDNCGPCRVDQRIAAAEAAEAEAIAAETGTPPPAVMPKGKGKAAALAAAAAAKETSPTRKADKRPIVPRQPAPADPPPATPEPAQTPEPVGAAA